MNDQSTVRQADSHCLQPGLSGSLANKIQSETFGVTANDDVSQLRAQLEQLTAERDRLAAQQNEIMHLINARSKEKIVHDLRNVLNELALLRAIADQEPA